MVPVMRVIFFGTYDERRHPRVAVLREGLLALGVELEIINQPFGDSTSDRLRAARHPLGALRWLGKLARAWWRLLKASTHATRPKAVLVGYLGVLDVLLARMRWPRTFLVLDHMAPLGGVAVDRALGRVPRATMEVIDRVAERVADLILFDTADHAALAHGRPERHIVVPVGATHGWYRPVAPSRDKDQPLSVVFFGLFTPLQGAPVIGTSIGLLAGRAIRFTMIGAGQEWSLAREAAASNAEVEWIDWIPSDQLPNLVASHDVCLGIFGSGPKAARVVPNKVFQGAAAGCAIVTMSSPAQRRALGDAALYVEPGDALELAAVLGRLADDRTLLEGYRSRARAAAESWRPEEVVKPLASAITAFTQPVQAAASKVSSRS